MRSVLCMWWHPSSVHVVRLPHAVTMRLDPCLIGIAPVQYPVQDVEGEVAHRLVDSIKSTGPNPTSKGNGWCLATSGRRHGSRVC